MKSLRKKQDILAKAVKERSADEKKELQQYNNKLKRIESNIIQDLLKKCPELRKQTKTAAHRISALRSHHDEQQKNEERQKDRLYKSQVRSTDTGEPTEKRRRQAETAAERKSASRSRQDANIDNLKCQDCENEEVHICPLEGLEDIETVNELNNERDDNEEYYDTGERVYKHVDEVTRTTVEDVTQVMEEDNIISDDQLSTVEDVTQVVESDSHLTEEEQKVYEILTKKQEINAIAVKE